MKKQNKLAGLQKRKAVSGYLFIMPFIVGFLVFMVKPFFESFYMSFCRMELGPGRFERFYVGLENYVRAFRVDPDFNRLLVEGLQKMFLNAVAIMVFSFFVALILNQKFKGRAFVRAIFFLPVILSSGVILGVEYNNTLMASMQTAIEENSNNASITGAIQNILMTSGIATTAFEKVFEVVDGIYDVAISSGIQIVIFLSGLQTISSSMYEAAQIEGCTGWESLWKITFPMISPLFLVNWIYSIVDYSMRSDNEVMNKISEQMLAYLDYGFASAMSWVYFLIMIVIVAISSIIISKGVYYYD